MDSHVANDPNNPINWDEKNNPKCNIDYCDKQVEMNDDYCEDHQSCYYCTNRLNCDDECPNNMNNLTLHKLTNNLIKLIKTELALSQENKNRLSTEYRLGINEAYLKILSILNKTIQNEINK